MHIMEGFLPATHAAGWTVASAPFVAAGLYNIKKIVKEHPEKRMLLGVAAAFSFVLSALKMPSVTGSSSHPTGTGLGGLMFGPLVMAPIGMVVLLFQALLLAHGGLTTLGANVFSMAVVGPFVAVGVFRAARMARMPRPAAIFAAAALGDLATYATTAFQLALAFPDASGGVVTSMAKFLSVFAFTQLPLAAVEGLLTVVVFGAIARFEASSAGEFTFGLRGAEDGRS